MNDIFNDLQEKEKQERKKNQRKLKFNSTCKDVNKLLPYDNIAFLNMINYMEKLIN